MDEITKKRLDGELKTVDRAMGSLGDAIESVVASLNGDLPALQAEMDRRIPAWAGDLTTMPGAMITFAMSRFARMGAPKGYPIDVLRAALEIGPRQRPQPGCERPVWLTPTCDGCGCESDVDAPGNYREQASQAIRILLFAYEELVEVVGDQQKTLETMGFMIEIFDHLARSAAM